MIYRSDMKKYNNFEITKILKTMIILYDTREQQNAALKRRLEGFTCPSLRHKLNFGDYSVAFVDENKDMVFCDSLVAVERKMSLDELCNCFTKGRSRFEREFIRAKENNAKVHLLIENGSYEKIFAEKYRSKLNPNALIASCLAWAERYNLQLHFCKPDTTPLLIEKILYYWLKNYLENLEAEDAGT